MLSLRQQFKRIQSADHGLITPVAPGRIWELSLPMVLRTEFTQTSLVLEQRSPFYYLHDNGSCNQGVAFHLNSHDQYVKSLWMHKYHVRTVSHKYYEIRFPKRQPNGVLKNVHNFTQFLLKLNRLFRIKI